MWWVLVFRLSGKYSPGTFSQYLPLHKIIVVNMKLISDSNSYQLLFKQTRERSNLILKDFSQKSHATLTVIKSPWLHQVFQSNVKVKSFKWNINWKASLPKTATSLPIHYNFCCTVNTFPVNHSESNPCLPKNIVAPSCLDIFLLKDYWQTLLIVSIRL